MSVKLERIEKNLEGAMFEGEEQFAQLLQGTVGRDLDSQRGRAGAEFSRMVEAENVKLKMEHGKSLARDLRRLKMWAGAASGLAACLACVVGLQVWLTGAGAGDVKTAVASGAVPVVDQVVYTRDVEGGTVLRQDVPMRVVRKQTVKRTQWFDPRENATFSVTEPVERVGYVPLQPY